MEKNELVPTEEQIKELAAKSTPTKMMESSLASFLNNTFTMVKEEDDYQKQIKAQIITNLPTMKNSELIALATSASTNKNDMISKLVNPTMQLLTAAQQNELALRQKENPVLTQTNIGAVSTAAPADVLLGLKTLFDLANKVQLKENQIVNEAI